MIGAVTVCLAILVFLARMECPVCRAHPVYLDAMDATERTVCPACPDCQEIRGHAVIPVSPARRVRRENRHAIRRTTTRDRRENPVTTDWRDCLGHRVRKDRAVTLGDRARKVCLAYPELAVNEATRAYASRA